MNHRFLSGFLALVFVLSLPLPLHAESAHLVDRIVGIVGKDPILLSEVNLALHAGAKKDDAAYRAAFDQIVSEKLLLAECKRSNLLATQEDIDSAIKNVRKQRGWSEETLRQALAGSNLTMEAYSLQLGKEICKMKLVQNKIRTRVQISKQDLLDAYRKRYVSNKKNLTYDLEELRVSVAPSNPNGKEEAKIFALGAQKKLVAHKDFAKAATQIAKDPSANAEFIPLGIVSKESLLPAMEESLAKAKAKETVGPVFALNAWHILHVRDVKEILPKPFEEVEKDLHNLLYEDELDRAFRAFVDELRSQADTQIFDMPQNPSMKPVGL